MLTSGNDLYDELFVLNLKVRAGYIAFSEATKSPFRAMVTGARRRRRFVFYRLKQCSQLSTLQEVPGTRLLQRSDRKGQRTATPLWNHIVITFLCSIQRQVRSRHLPTWTSSRPRLLSQSSGTRRSLLNKAIVLHLSIVSALRYKAGMRTVGTTMISAGTATLQSVVRRSREDLRYYVILGAVIIRVAIKQPLVICSMNEHTFIKAFHKN